VLALARDGITETISEGSVEGQILSYPRGAGGFGYDPLFWLAEHQQTMAEIDLATKQQISHRGRALQEMLQNLL
jgi:XTP/dITP diphosphohydrolase